MTCCLDHLCSVHPMLIVLLEATFCQFNPVIWLLMAAASRERTAELRLWAGPTRSSRCREDLLRRTRVPCGRIAPTGGYFRVFYFLFCFDIYFYFLFFIIFVCLLFCLYFGVCFSLCKGLIYVYKFFLTFLGFFKNYIAVFFYRYFLH